MAWTTGSRRMQFSRKLEAHEKFQASQEQWMSSEGVPGVPGSQETQEKWFISTPLLHIRVPNCKWGIFLLQNCVGASECEWARSHHLYYFPLWVFNISELSFSGGAQCLHSGYWESYLTQLRHFYSLSTFHTIKTHSRKWKVLQRYVQSFIAPTSNCFGT